MSVQHLYSLDNFFASPMWSGTVQFDKICPWFGWIYISEFNSFEEKAPTPLPNLKFKIGITFNLDKRKKELEKSTKTNKNIQNSSTIIYGFSVPCPMVFDTKIKHFLRAFIQKENTSGRTDITHGLTLETLIHVIQLCVLDTCLEHNFINYCDAGLEIVKLKRALRSPPDVIIDNRTRYSGQKLSKNVIQIFNVDKVWLRLNLQDKAKYPTSGEPGMFVQWVFNSGTDESGSRDDRIENPNLKDSDTITDDFVQENPNKTNIKNPYFVGECVFTKYKKTYMPCRIIGYGLGLHSGTYAIEWLDFTLDNEIMTFPIDDGGRYKTWLDIVGNPARHEYKSPNEVVSWHTVRTNHERPDVEQWPSNADRKNRDAKGRGLVNRAAYTYAASPDKPIVNNRIRFLQQGDWWRGTIEEVNKMYKWYKVQADTGGTTQKRFNEFTTEKYAQTWEFLTAEEEEEESNSLSDSTQRSVV